MTNYNERLDEVLETLNNKAREERASCTERKNWEGYNSAYERLEHEAKQAITSLIKELVAEVIGEDEWSGIFPAIGESSAMRDDLRADQRTRLQSILAESEQDND